LMQLFNGKVVAEHHGLQAQRLIYSLEQSTTDMMKLQRKLTSK